MMRLSILAAAAMALAACAAPEAVEAPPPAAAAPPAAAEAPPGIAIVKEGSDGLRVSGPTAGQDDLAPLHCAAAKHARDAGAATLEWLGGVAKKTDDSYSADLTYQTTGPGASLTIGRAPGRAGDAGAKPEDGGAVAVANWLKFCDEAGVPREGAATEGDA